MKLKVVSVNDNEEHSSERVFINVLEATDLTYYILRDTTYTEDNHISNKWQHVYKFHKQIVNAGDQVVLYTKTGKDDVRTFANGKKQYIYYWGLDSSVWNNTGDGAVLYEIRGWETFKVKPL